MRYARAGLFAMAMLSAGALGCHRQHVNGAPAAARAAQNEVVRLVVDNENLSNVDVFVVHDDGFRTRVGTVTAGATNDYTLTSDLWATGTVRLIATPIGGFGVARSGALTVFGGNTISFTIRPDVNMSSAMVR